MTGLTHDEAVQKMCPTRHSITNYYNGVLGRKEVPMLGNEYCEGKTCIAWRWMPAHWRSLVSSEKRGYCGLAGKPE